MSRLSDKTSPKVMSPPWHTSAMNLWLKRTISKTEGVAFLILCDDVLQSSLFVEEVCASLLCEAKNSPMACKICSSCLSLQGQCHGDFLEITSQEGKNTIGIDQIREAKNFIQLTPLYGGVKCLIVKEADKMTISASNSLLKTLEEPPKNSVLFLSTSMVSKLPATIRSRCQFFILPRPTSNEVKDWLIKNGHLAHEIDLVLKRFRHLPMQALKFMESDRKSKIDDLESSFFDVISSKKTLGIIPPSWNQLEPAELLLGMQRWIEIRVTDDAASWSRETLCDWLKFHALVSKLLMLRGSGITTKAEVLFAFLSQMGTLFGSSEFSAIADRSLRALERSNILS